MMSIAASTNNTPDNTGGSFVRQRSQQLAASMQPAPSAQGAQGEQAAPDARQQQQQPQEQQPAIIRVGDADFSVDELRSAIAAKAEADVRKNTLPKSDAEYLARNSADFKLPEGVSFQFDERDPLLANVRKVALMPLWV